MKIVCTILTWLAASWAQAASGDLDQLLQRVEQTGRVEAQLRREREDRFRQARDQQETLLSELRKKLAAESERGEQLKARFADNEANLKVMAQALQDKTGDLGELFGTVRQSAADLRALIEESPVNPRYPQRLPLLNELTDSRALPDIGQLGALALMLQREIVESGRIVRMPAQVVGNDGLSEDREIVRVGLFTALDGADYLRYNGANQRFEHLPRPPARVEPTTVDAFNTPGPGYAPLVIDPTRGTLMGMLMQTPAPLERLHQGGVVGYAILAVGALGLLIALLRMTYLAMVQLRLRRQLADLGNPREDNPLGRVLRIAQDADTASPENLELRLDEAVLRELPRLTRGEGLLKLLAGVAPLLGLLGTVVGMILTFQAISLFGTGDPKLMANGISQALVTTAMGLLVAIPLLFLHSLVAARGRSLSRLLDQQALGLAMMARE